MLSISQRLIRPAPEREAYGALSVHMNTIVSVASHIEDNFAHLTQLCDSNGPQNLMQEKPFLLIAACFYLDAAAQWADDRGGEALPKIIVKSCGSIDGNSSPPLTKRLRNNRWEWDGLDDVINTIYRYHNPSNHSTNSPATSTSLVNASGHDNNV